MIFDYQAERLHYPSMTKHTFYAVYIKTFMEMNSLKASWCCYVKQQLWLTRLFPFIFFLLLWPHFYFFHLQRKRKTSADKSLKGYWAAIFRFHGSLIAAKPILLHLSPLYRIDKGFDNQNVKICRFCVRFSVLIDIFLVFLFCLFFSAFCCFAILEYFLLRFCDF